MAVPLIAQPSAFTSGGTLSPTGNSFVLGQALIGFAAAPGGAPSINAGLIPALFPPCAAEFNGDGDLNADDLSDYITCYFTNPPCPEANFNQDGDVNADDLADYITAYFNGCR